MNPRVSDESFTADGVAPFKGLLLLWGLGCLLAFVGLGDLPLRDFDEGTVARVSYEFIPKSGIQKLLPTIWNEPYLNKPPGLHWLIAFAMGFDNTNSNVWQSLPNEFYVRIIPAFLSSFVVPFGGLIQWKLTCGDRNVTLVTSGILLTLMPLVRHGRLAMLDGTQLSCIALLWLLIAALDSCSYTQLKMLGIGLVSSCMLMLKAPLLLPVLFAGLVALAWGKAWKNWWTLGLLLWFALGLAPGLGWHFFHWWQRGHAAFWLWGGDGAMRVLLDAGEGSDLGWRVPLIEILEGGWPWLLLWPFGVMWAWRRRKSLWGQWALSTQLVMMLAIFPLKTQLPWYSHPLWLPFALLCAPPLVWLINRDSSQKPPYFRVLERVPSLWQCIGLILVFVSSLGLANLFSAFSPYSLFTLPIGAGLCVGGNWLCSSKKTQRRYGIFMLMSGSYLALMFLMTSPLWLWELNETWPVDSLRELISRAPETELVLEGNEERPSLNWYAGKRIASFQSRPNAEWILTQDPIRLNQKVISLSRICKIVDSEEAWSLMFCGSD
ncbi:4-amino-4-deoxy-L-arabinose transferase [Prochlorococcus sp. MIT 1300]|uniref:ArnT family glycosyltransferase n=1 Tax=Prochlorococcus sp. MIT 1300 TaxID=3096218 RepID=UPI002A75C1DB|nr:4-amino-4-deoxy-L-arabinose transferase [Prochlorococcus sp. MIT 1300]